MAWLEISYLLASVAYILGLKKLSHPDTAKQGNLLAAVGMGIAILATLIFHVNDEGHHLNNIMLILLAMAIGTGIGWQMAMKVQMTAMPQMVSFFNGMGGACAALISLIEYQHSGSADTGMLTSIYLGLIIGSVSFSGSIVAYGKLDGKINDSRAPWLRGVNLGLLLLIVLLLVAGLVEPGVVPGIPWILLTLSLLYGVLFVLPIGGADMPVVISLLNSFTGVAAAMGGLLYNNYSMLTGGILVGSAGTILTILMTKAMNRSLTNVLLGAFSGSGSSTATVGDQTVKPISVNDTAVMCAYAQKVCIIPGYGLAVAQAQHTCHEVEKLLEEKGVEVYYAIHPVAGRMPGHMNVLLAEADVPYPKLLEMEEANPQMPQTDVAIVIGANDVVNPAAETDPGSPIYGMPIIQANKARHVIVLKRSMGKGYAGIENELFFHDRTRMLFGDAKNSLQQLAAEIKSL